jgi:hypothetical protein
VSANSFRRDAMPLQRKPDERLHAIAGRWDTSGYVIGEPRIPVVGTDTYEVLPGGFFLSHRVDVTVGDHGSAPSRSSASRTP